MSNYLEFMGGSAAGDDNNPPIDDNSGVRFPADGVEHKCGWTKYVPNIINNKASVTLKLYFIDQGSGAGNVQLDFIWYVVNSSGVITDSGSLSELVAVPNNPNTVFSADINITDWLSSDPELLLITLARDSSNPNDTFADYLTYITGKTV